MQPIELETFRTAALRAAVVWWTYGLLETVLLLGDSFAKKIAALTASALLPTPPVPFVSAGLTAICLVVFPIVGATLAVIQAACFSVCRGPREPREAASRFWSAAALVTLSVLFAVNARRTGQGPMAVAAVLPAGLGLAAMVSAWRARRRPAWDRLTHPVTGVLMLAGGAALLHARPGRETLALVLSQAGFAFVVGVLAVGLGPLLARGIQSSSLSSRTLRTSSILVLSLGTLLAARQTGMKAVLEGPDPAPKTVHPGDRRPNVVLIVLDAVRADHVSAFGYARATTPFLDEWVADDATRYTRAMASSNWTLPSVASIVTGRHPRIHGARWSEAISKGLPLSDRTPTLAEVLSRSGYRTAGIVANSVVLRLGAFGIERGFAEYDCTPLADTLTRGSRGYLLRETVRKVLVDLFAPRRTWARFLTADSVLSRAEAFLASAEPQRRPFFLYLHFMDTHDPYLPPSGFDRLFPGMDPRFSWSTFAPGEDDKKRLVRSLRPEDETLPLISLYDGAIAYTDDRLRKLVGSLRSRGLYDDSLVIVTSDHGDAFGEHGYLFHGRSLYQEQLHVPLVVKFPRAKAARTVDTLVSGVDIFPTVLEAAGVRPLSGADGRSLSEGGEERRWVVAEAFNLGAKGGDPRGIEPDEVALFSGPLKRIWKRGGIEETYDLSIDPGETKNLGPDPRFTPDWDLEYRRYLASGTRLPAGRPVADPELVKGLRSLGYIR